MPVHGHKPITVEKDNGIHPKNFCLGIFHVVVINAFVLIHTIIPISIDVDIENR